MSDIKTIEVEIIPANKLTEDKFCNQCHSNTKAMIVNFWYNGLVMCSRCHKLYFIEQGEQA